MVVSIVVFFSIVGWVGGRGRWWEVSALSSHPFGLSPA